MPTYDYECEACGHAFEKFQPITSRPVRKCPHCQKNKVRRLIGMGAGIIFKGSGFYQTDYRSDSYKKDAEKDKKPSGETKNSGETSGGDSKASGDKPKKAASAEAGSD